MASVLLSSSKESMLTRNKSSQKKLHNKTMKTLNQLLLRPNITISKKSLLLKNFNNHTTDKKKVEIPILNLAEDSSKRPLLNSEQSKSMQKSETLIKKIEYSKRFHVTENVEFYPDKLKRTVTPKKIRLQPKHKYRVIATMNKRKKRIPHRELKSPPAKEAELTMADLVQMADEEEMDDEDLIEILTCPSPVWWEDYNYTEEIRIRFHEDTKKQHNTAEEYHHYAQVLLENSNLKAETDFEDIFGSDKTQKSLKTDINFFKKFVKKRSKLETVLGNIKIMKTRSNESRNSFYDETRKVRTDSTSGLSEASINDEELLKTLENIEIPVQDSNSDFDKVSTSEDDNLKYTRYMNTIDNPNKPSENHDKCIRPKQTQNDKKRTRRLCKSKNKSNIIKHKLVKTSNKIKKERNNESTSEIKTDLEIVPSDLPPLTKNPFQNVSTKSTLESPKSTESITSETTNSSVIELDSISDTNIKFLDEYDEKTESNKNDMNELNLNAKSKNDMVTIYRIIPNNDNVDIEEQIKANLVNKSPVKSQKNTIVKLKLNEDSKQINSFYKKRKSLRNNTTCKQLKEIDTQSKKTDAIGDTVKNDITPVTEYKYIPRYRNRGQLKRILKTPNSKVKYCYKCSSIFETDTCLYCTKKSK